MGQRFLEGFRSGMALRGVFSKIVGTARPTHDEEFLALARKGGVEALARIESLLDGRHISGIDIADAQKSTALHLAVGNNDIDLVRLLLHHQASVNAADAEGRTPLMRAADYALTMGRLQNAEIGGLLIAFGSSVHQQDARGKDALRHAAETENTELLKIISSHGGQANVPDAGGMTTADYARSRGLHTVLSLLNLPEDAGEIKPASGAPAPRPTAGKP